MLIEIGIAPLIAIGNWKLAIGNLYYLNVRKCPVLSGLPNAIPVITNNPLYEKDLQQFPLCGRPDMPDIPPRKTGAPTTMSHRTATLDPARRPEPRPVAAPCGAAEFGRVSDLKAARRHGGQCGVRDSQFP